MQIIRPFLWGFILTLFSLQAFAWKVNLQSSEKSDDTPQVIVSNDREMAQVDVYLVWFDLDAKADKVFLSWRFQWGWQTGLKPVFSTAIELPPFESYNIPFQEKTCPQEHRCFLAFLATPDGKSPLNGQKNWQATSFLPLSLSAGCERFPGQQFFLSCGDSAINRFAEGDAMDDVAMTGAAPPAEKVTVSDEGAAPETEKPDIFKLLDHQLLYANGQAKRFQVIDIADLSNPRLAGWTALAGSPRELYVLGDYYVLLQTNYVGKEGTHLTVLRQDDDNTLTTVQEMSLSGRFIESRRRGSFIYSVTEQFNSVMDCGDKDCVEAQQTINITVLRLSETGQLEEVDKAELSGYSPTIAIFPDHLIIANHNPEEGKWRSTQVQAFDLSQVVDPLVTLPLLKVPGQIPSEFHLSVKNQQLRVVYGPEDRKDGSTLAIYDLTSPEMALVGEISKIAPGEDLFATRFVENRAFVVTFERKDPLWVIDLTDPTSPSILGELHVPGWSEKMFFHEDRLFAVGIDDQPLENEEKRWVRRVALSLFDVKDPTQPTLINRFTPLAGEVAHSWSQALDDERALLLNWDKGFAALPIESYETEAGSHLQIVSLANDKIEDAGILESPVPIQRSLSLSENVLAALGDQSLMTLRWGTGKPEVLGELELATNLTWLTLQKNDLWAAARGNKGFNRLYRFTTKEVETPAQRWTLPKGYNGLQMDDSLAVFYNHYPLTVQVLEVKTGKLSPPQPLEKTKEPSEVNVEPVDDVEKVDVEVEYIPNIWYDRSQPLVRDGWFYIAEQRPFKPTLEQAAFVPEQAYPQPQWILRSWNVKVEGAPEALIRSIPGRPLAFDKNGHLITQETTEKGQLRLNLLALEVDNARLLHSRELSCGGYSRVMSIDEAVYVNCEENRYQPGPITYSESTEESQEATTQESQEPTTQESQEPTTQLLKLKVNPGQGFMDEGNWHLSGYQNLRAVSDDVVLMASDHYWYSPWMEGGVAVKSAMMLPPYEESGCHIYQLLPDKEPVLLKQLETCPYSDEGLVLTANQVWMAEGFSGIKAVSW
ncbi:MAG: beta-propeller domain-containing protein [Thiomargarita sp.]|nr:beta-propeller domain-containing protein [Thiomargarita sp.]